MLIQRELRENHEIVRPILQFIYECVEANDNASVFHRGITNLLNFPEYRDISKARRILDFLDDKSSLQKAFVYRECENVTILIGSENRALELKDCSVILSPYHIDGKIVGTIGFIGPTRMNYAKAVSNIEFLAGQLNKLSDKFTNENDF
jgi:heat-inducible transcriptional repressor